MTFSSFTQFPNHSCDYMVTIQSLVLIHYGFCLFCNFFFFGSEKNANILFWYLHICIQIEHSLNLLKDTFTIPSIHLVL